MSRIANIFDSICKGNDPYLYIYDMIIYYNDTILDVTILVQICEIYTLKVYCKQLC